MKKFRILVISVFHWFFIIIIFIFLLEKIIDFSKNIFQKSSNQTSWVFQDHFKKNEYIFNIIFQVLSKCLYFLKPFTKGIVFNGWGLKSPDEKSWFFWKHFFPRLNWPPNPHQKLWIFRKILYWRPNKKSCIFIRKF